MKKSQVEFRYGNAESVSIHIYPETNTIYADIFSCKTLNKENIAFMKEYGAKY